MEVPDVSYAWSGEVAIAYQALGDGPPDLVLLRFLSNIYTLWAAPGFDELGRRLATGRLIVVNPRGVGLSDRGAHELKGVPGSWRLYAVSQ